MSALLADVRCACPLCERSFPNEAALVEHCGGLLPEPDDEPFFCSCGAFFCSPQSLAGHCDATGHAPEGAEAFGDEYPRPRRNLPSRTTGLHGISTS